MAVDLVTVTGSLETLTGGSPYLGRLAFQLVRPDWNLFGEIFAPVEVEAVADGAGAFTVALQATSAMQQGSYYTAILRYRDTVSNSDKTFTVANFLLPSGGPYTLSELLVIGTGTAQISLPAGQVYTRAQVEAMGDIWPGQNCILVNESGFVLPFLRDPLATDLIGTDGTAWRKAGMSVADAVAIGASVASSAVFAVTSSDIFATYGGTANAITLTTAKPYSSIPVGAQIRFRATATNTGAAYGGESDGC